MIGRLASVLCLGFATSSQAITIDFDEYSHGDVVSSIDVLGVTGTVTADANTPGAPDVAMAFDTTAHGTANWNLEGPFPNAALTRWVDAGRALVVQETYNRDANDDDLGGTITFEFDGYVDFFGFMMLDHSHVTVRSDRGDEITRRVFFENSYRIVQTEWIGVRSLTFDFNGGGGAINDLLLDPSEVSPIPLPASLPLLGAALGAFGWAAARRKRR